MNPEIDTVPRDRVGQMTAEALRRNWKAPKVRRLATSEAEFNPVNSSDSEGFVS